jgi:TetR/AcrR family tetracycline transcriptional repressor
MSTAPKGLTRDGVVEAAIVELDAVGLDALSTRGVARRLGVQAPALYWHVGSKRGLLDAMGTRLWRPAIDAAVATAVADAPEWTSTVVVYARTLRASLGAHRDGARLAGSTRIDDVELVRSMEEALTRFAAAGVEVASIVTLIQTVQHATIGFCLAEEVSARREKPDLTQRQDRLADTPRVAGIGELVLGPADERFEAMLDLVASSVRLRR